MNNPAATLQARAALLWEQGRRAEAIALFTALQAEQPGNIDIALRLGIALIQVGRLLDAVRLLEPVTAAAPHTHPVHDWLGRAIALIHWQERGPDAIPALRDLLAADPTAPVRHTSLAFALLSCGQLDEAWPHYAWRWLGMPTAHRAPAEPLIRPDPASWRGRRVLLFAEQGLGDVLQFLRYVKLVMAHAAEVTVEVYPPLRRLAARLPGSPAIVAVGDAVPPHDVAVPLMHLPWAFGTTLATIPAETPYLQADPAAVAAWRARLDALPGRKVGLVWSGDPRPEVELAFRVDRRRSLPLAALAPLARVPGVTFISLQKGAGAAQAAQPPAGMMLHDWTSELGDFADTAALMQALDLVISVDTSPLHLAGGLGRPVWLLNRYDSCWRWLRNRDDSPQGSPQGSPWYPTLRQFRQSSPGDWDDVIQRVATALTQAAATAPEPGNARLPS